ncbi:MAG: acyl carrier protein [Bacteroidia bacterium]|jgi:acyl carrier protein|nr:acyl carrier protein [Bacteroidia bacterium]
MNHHYTNSAALASTFLDTPVHTPAPAQPAKTLREMREIIKAHILDISGAEAHAYTAKARFKEDLAMDSLDMVELVMLTERDLGVSLPDRDWVNLRTVGEIESLLEGRTNR